MPDGRRSGRWAEWQRADGGRCRANQLREHRSLDRAPTAVTHSFLDFIETSRRGNSARSRNTRLAASRSSFKYVAINEPELLHHCQQVLALTSKRHEKRMIDYLDREQIEALLAAPDLLTWYGRRYSAPGSTNGTTRPTGHCS